MSDTEPRSPRILQIRHSAFVAEHRTMGGVGRLHCFERCGDDGVGVNVVCGHWWSSLVGSSHVPNEP